MRVVNEGAPSVRILSPADGTRVLAGQELPVRAESRDASLLWMAVNGARRWATAGDRLAGGWAPPAGTHTIVAVAEREGAPDGVDSVTITAVADPAGLAPPPTDPGGGADPGGAVPGAPAPADAGRGGAGVAPGAPGAGPRARMPGPIAPRTRAGGDRAPAAARGGVPPSGPGAALRQSGGTTAGPAGGGGSPWHRLIAGDLRMVARAAALPLLLLLAAGAYALLQRFIDGGAKLAWRGRGRPDDVVVEF